MIVDLYAGPGGWDEGLRTLGITDVVGLEWDEAACSTRAAAGHRTIRTDVATYPTDPFVGRVRGLIASPPCQAFSMAGKGAGRAEIARVHAAVELCRSGWTDAAVAGSWKDERTPHILQPLRWAWALRDSLEWIACEQVPPALGVWEHMADVLRSWGFRADARILCAADYGVPQTRNRAFLLARRSRLAWPEPTHAEKPEPSLFGASRKPWVSMAAALGWDVDEGLKDSVGAGRLQRNPHIREVWPADAPSPPVREKFRSAYRVRLNPGRTDTQPNRRLYGVNEPAPTVGFGHDANNWQWVHERPAPSMVGKWSPDIVAAPTGRRQNGQLVSRQDTPGSVRVEVWEAGVLQGFRRDYPWQGSKSKQYEQVGNAVCPPVAAAIVAAVDAIPAATERAA